MFPDFYYITQKGINLEELVKTFSSVDEKKVKSFVIDLVNKKILVCSMLSPHELFYPVSRLIEHEYGNDLIYNPEMSEKFKKIQLNRTFLGCLEDTYKLEDNKDMPELIKSRYSHRQFKESEKISYSDFSRLLSSFRQIRDDNGKISYYFASAGGLYPIDIFIYVKPMRVESVKEVLYYYDPIGNRIQLVNDRVNISEEAHFFINKKIFNSSAISVYFVYNARANMPKYKGMGYFYGCVDSGIMISNLTLVAEQCGMGLCTIGDMDFEKIRKYFKLSDDHVFLHVSEIGLKCE